MVQRLLVISPVHNEAAHIERVAAAVAAQTRPPDAWIVINDGSVDETGALLARLAREIEFMSVHEATPLPAGPTNDRLALAAEARAFNQALSAAELENFTHIAKLDGDVELPPDYFEGLLREFSCDPQLGLAGGVLSERTGQGWEIAQVPLAYHVRGALKCYSAECLRAIGGIEELLGWDTIDEIRARMHGYGTRSIPALVAVHHRRLASADGILRGRARHGRCLYIARFPLSWVTLRAAKTALRSDPRVLSGAAFLGGYLRAAINRDVRVEDPEFRNWVRRELAARALTAAGMKRVATMAAPITAGVRSTGI
jgi:poly-beta-1,6-N-acetyl-D-glucosamine synthase